MDMNSSDQSIDAVLSCVKSERALSSKAPRFAGHFGSNSWVFAHRGRRGAVAMLGPLNDRRRLTLDVQHQGGYDPAQWPRAIATTVREIAQWRIASMADWRDGQRGPSNFEIVTAIERI